MQINNTTNTHNKNLGFQGVKIDPDLAEFGSGFAKELQKAKQELEKRYKNKIDVVIKRGYKEVGDEQAPSLVHFPLILVEASKTFNNVVEVVLSQSFLDKIFNRPATIKYGEEKLVRGIKIGVGENFISPKMTSEEIIQAVKDTTREAKKSLHQQFNGEYGTSDVRRAKRILAGKGE